jgi:hypothetical protein
MSVIFQLFCAEDLQKLEYQELQTLRQRIITALRSAQPLCLNLTEKPEPDPGTPPRVHEALNKRFDEVSHQLKSPQLNPSQQPFRFHDRIQQRNARATQDKEDLILNWAITCEVNNFEFYNSLLQVKKAADDFFEQTIKAKIAARGEPVPDRVRPLPPDSPYSPFNPRHPLYGLYYDLSQPKPDPTPDTPPSTS